MKLRSSAVPAPEKGSPPVTAILLAILLRPLVSEDRIRTYALQLLNELEGLAGYARLVVMRLECASGLRCDSIRWPM